MQTTVILFENHPNLANIKFVVLPLIREFIMARDDVNMDIYQLMECFTENKCGINFDFSNILKLKIPQIWAIDVMGR